MSIKEPINSLLRGLQIMELVAQHKQIGVREISRQLDIPRSTVSRLANNLVKSGFLFQEPQTRDFRLSFKLFRLGKRAIDNFNVRDFALPVMGEIARQTHETVNLYIPYEDELLLIEKIDATHALKIYTRIGDRLPIYCTSVGKVLLAWLDESERKDLLLRTELRPFTPKTIYHPDELEEEVVNIRGKGYALSNEEFNIGVLSVGAPIFGPEGKAIAGISIALPAARESFTADELGEIVKGGARQISFACGGARQV